MIILGRLLKLDADGDETDVPIILHLPVDTQDHWRCDYEIGWPEGVRRGKGLGIDSIQALLIALTNNDAITTDFADLTNIGYLFMQLEK